MLSVQLAWLQDLKQHAIGKLKALSDPEINPPVYPRRKCQKSRESSLQNFSSKNEGLGDMFAPWELSLSWQGRNLRIQTSCHNIQIKRCLWQPPCEPESASNTEAQQKPVKQDKSSLCQACILHNTAEMTTAEYSAYAAGMYLKMMTNHILRRPVQASGFQKCHFTARQIQREQKVQYVQIKYHVGNRAVDPVPLVLQT